MEAQASILSTKSLASRDRYSVGHLPSLLSWAGHSEERPCLSNPRHRIAFADPSDHVRDLLGFDEPDVLRGSSLTRVLHRGASVMQNRSGSEATYQLSAPVNKLDAFVSYNWSMSRWEKFLILAFFFNLRKATITTLIVITVFFIFEYIELVPYAWAPSSSAGFGWGAVFSTPVFLLMLFFGHEILSCCGYAGRRLFLDKTCIHQTDAQLKQRGIEKLGAFIKNADCIVICYGPLYLKKLWTVFEVASFLIVHPVTAMHVVPVCYPVFVISLGILDYGGLYLQALLLHAAYANIDGHQCVIQPQEGVLVVAAGIGMTLLHTLIPFMLMRWWSCEQISIREAVTAFRIRNAIAFDESDRSLVEGSIVAYMKCFGFVNGACDDDEALDMFDALVQEAIPKAFRARFGRCGIPFTHVLAVSLGSFATVIEKAFLSLRFGCSSRQTAIELIFGLGSYPGFLATIIAIMSLGINRQRRRRGLGRILYLLGVLSMTILVYFAWIFMFYELYTRAYNTGEPIPTALFCLSFCLWLMAIAWSYRPMSNYKLECFSTSSGEHGPDVIGRFLSEASTVATRSDAFDLDCGAVDLTCDLPDEMEDVTQPWPQGGVSLAMSTKF